LFVEGRRKFLLNALNRILTNQNLTICVIFH
jgi:hypothetical protein